MRRKVASTTVFALLVAGLAGCASPGSDYRPNRSLNDGRQFDVSCEGSFDEAPRLESGKTPVFPVSMLNPYVIEDRKVRRLPMEWPVHTTFDVDAHGRTANVQSSPTAPPSFSAHMTVAVRAWRFTPAMSGGAAVPSHCEVDFTYQLDG